MALKCTSCQTYVTKIPVNWKCPHCGEKLPEPTKWFLFYESSIEGLQDKGAIFWSIWFGIFLLFVGVIELVFGYGYLLNYFIDSMLMTLFGIVLGGILIDMAVKINLPLRLPYGTDFIVRERAAIRNIRKATNFAFVAGLLTSLFWIKPVTFFLYFPSYIVTIAWFLAFAWSIVGLFLDPRWLDDIRFRAYLERLGLFSLKRFRRFSTIMLATLIFSAILFNVLNAIPGLWQKLRNWGLVGAFIHFIDQYLSWLF